MEFGSSTSLIHLGNHRDVSGAVMPPIVLSTTFEREDDGLTLRQGYLYTRYDNPNRRALEAKLAHLENGADAICFASGLAAAMAVFHSLEAGDHVVLPDDIYFGVRNIIAKLYAKWNLHFTAVDMTDLAQVDSTQYKSVVDGDAFQSPCESL